MELPGYIRALSREGRNEAVFCVKAGGVGSCLRAEQTAAKQLVAAERDHGFSLLISMECGL